MQGTGCNIHHRMRGGYGKMDFISRMNQKKERLARLEEAFMLGLGMVVGGAIIMALMAVM